VREMSATGGGDGIREANGGLVLPSVLRPVPGEGISAGLAIPRVFVKKWPRANLCHPLKTGPGMGHLYISTHCSHHRILRHLFYPELLRSSHEIVAGPQA
jgi:hypothetical protein